MGFFYFKNRTHYFSQKLLITIFHLRVLGHFRNWSYSLLNNGPVNRFFHNTHYQNRAAIICRIFDKSALHNHYIRNLVTFGQLKMATWQLAAAIGRKCVR